MKYHKQESTFKVIYHSVKNFWFPPCEDYTFPMTWTEHPKERIKIWEVKDLKDCPKKISITLDAWKRMMYLARNCKNEMGGHLEIEETPTDIIVKRIHIPEQEVTGGSYEPSIKSLAKENPKVISKIKGWFHSHYNFSTFWSGTDEETIGNNLNVFGTYCLSIVVNSKNDCLVRLDYKGEVYDNLPIKIVMEDDKELNEWSKLEIKQKNKKFQRGTL